MKHIKPGFIGLAWTKSSDELNKHSKATLVRTKLETINVEAYNVISMKIFSVN